MSNLNRNKTLDGTFMTYSEMNKAMDLAIKEGRKVVRTGLMSWVTTEGQTEVTPWDGRLTDEQVMEANSAQMTTATTDVQTVTTDVQTGTTDVQTVTTDVQTETTDGQTATTTLEEDVVVASGDNTVTDGQTLTSTGVEEETMVEEADPLASSPPSPTLVMDSDDLTASHHSVVDSHPADTSPLGNVEHEVQKMDDGDDDMDGVRRSASGIARRVAGRRRVVVMEDDSETAMSVVSLSSADEGSSMATSSSCARKRKGVKRGRETVKEKARTQEGSSEERKRKRKKEKEKKREIGKKKDTPELEEEVGKQGEPKGVVAHVFEDMSSPVLGGAIHEWASRIEDIRVKSKNIQGRLSGELKKCVANIIEGAALLVVRADATGDPQFLRMRNSELVARLREVESENARLREQARRKSPVVPSSPPCKRKERVVARKVATDAAREDPVESADQLVREDFPPLPQRPPREARDGGTKKKGLRIVSDVQVAPPYKERRKEEGTAPEVSGSEAEWRVAAGSKRKGRIKGDKPLPPPLPLPAHPSHPPIPGKGRPPPIRQQQPKIRLPRVPTSSAVMVTGRAEGFSYAEVMRDAREHIKLETLGITVSRVRKAQNGGMLIEISGEDSRQKAEELTGRLQSFLKESAAVACPVKKRELTVVGFDESVTLDEIAEALSASGGCPKTDVKLGPIRTMNNGLGMVWVQLPVAAAAKAAEEGRVRVGWTSARVELLKVRPLQCYKCWAFGHMQNACRNMADRRGACFRCGQKGHVASTCRNAVHCAVCHDAGLEAAHRLGGPQCVAQGSQGK